MKIAFIGQKGMPTKSGGVDRHVEYLAIFLVQKNQEVIVYNRKNYLPEKIGNWKGVKLIHLPFINHKNLAAITHGFLATFDAIFKKVDVIHYHGIGPSLLAWIPRLLSPKTKVISTLHSFDYGNDKWSSFAKYMLKLGEKTMCKFAHEVIVLTDLMHDYLLQRHGRESYVIPNGAYVEKTDNDELLKSFGLTKDKYIITVSRLIRLKGLQYLIEAFNRIEGSDIKLAIVGDGEYMETLEKLAEDNPNIIFTGNQTDKELRQLYSNAKLFVQSSEMEGLSISLLEAMAYGLPSLVSDISANKQAAQETAFYFRSKSVDDLENKLKQVLNNDSELKDKAEMARRRAETIYNWDKISQDTLNVYQNKK